MSEPTGPIGVSRVAELGTVLGIWAHPDDEAYLSGGLMALATDAGSRVVCVTATRGELGTADPATWPPHRLAQERATELARSLATLGVVEHHWLDLPDGGCAALDPAGPVARLAGLIEVVRPDTVLTFGPDGITGHDDHKAVGAWADAAWALAARRGCRLLHSCMATEYFAEWEPLDTKLGIYPPGLPVCTPVADLAVHLELDGATAARKVAALAAQATQTSGLIDQLGLSTFTGWVGMESFIRAA